MDTRLLADIKQAEGCKLKAYRDSLGLWTIGYGHLLDQTIDWTGHEITQEVADKLLEKDIETACAEAQTLPEWLCLDTLCRQNAFIELIFNMGKEHWESFKHTRNAILSKDWQLVHDNLLESLWAKEVGFYRSTRLANYLLIGTYP